MKSMLYSRRHIALKRIRFSLRLMSKANVYCGVMIYCFWARDFRGITNQNYWY